MNKRESEVPILLLAIALALVLGSFFAYDSMAARYYATSQDAWKDFWLPVLTNLFATLITFVLAYLFLKRSHANAQIDHAEQVANLVFAKIEEMLRDMKKAGKDEALVELLTSVLRDKVDFKESRKPSESESSNKETGPATRTKIRTK